MHNKTLFRADTMVEKKHNAKPRFIEKWDYNFDPPGFHLQIYGMEVSQWNIINNIRMK